MLRNASYTDSFSMSTEDEDFARFDRSSSFQTSTQSSPRKMTDIEDETILNQSFYSGPSSFRCDVNNKFHFNHLRRSIIESHSTRSIAGNEVLTSTMVNSPSLQALESILKPNRLSVLAEEKYSPSSVSSTGTFVEEDTVDKLPLMGGSVPYGVTRSDAAAQASPEPADDINGGQGDLTTDRPSMKMVSPSPGKHAADKRLVARSENEIGNQPTSKQSKRNSLKAFLKIRPKKSAPQAEERPRHVKSKSTSFIPQAKERPKRPRALSFMWKRKEKEDKPEEEEQEEREEKSLLETYGFDEIPSSHINYHQEFDFVNSLRDDTRIVPTAFSGKSSHSITPKAFEADLDFEPSATPEFVAPQSPVHEAPSIQQVPSTPKRSPNLLSRDFSVSSGLGIDFHGFSPKSAKSPKNKLMGEALFPKSLDSREVEDIVSLERSRSLRSTITRDECYPHEDISDLMGLIDFGDEPLNLKFSPIKTEPEEIMTRENEVPIDFIKEEESIDLKQESSVDFKEELSNMESPNIDSPYSPIMEPLIKQETSPFIPQRPMSMSFKGNGGSSLIQPSWGAMQNSKSHLTLAMPSPSSSTEKIKKGVQFSSRVILYETHHPDDYDRHPESATCNQLTPALAQEIKDELNAFKQLMPIHELSQIYTHFF